MPPSGQLFLRGRIGCTRSSTACGTGVMKQNVRLSNWTVPGRVKRQFIVKGNPASRFHQAVGGTDCAWQVR